MDWEYATGNLYNQINIKLETSEKYNIQMAQFTIYQHYDLYPKMNCNNLDILVLLFIKSCNSGHRCLTIFVFG